MAKMGKLEADDSGQMLDRETADTLAAIDEGRKDARTVRVVQAPEVRKRLSDWAKPFSAPKER